MGLLSNRNPPNLPVPPKEYDSVYMNQLLLTFNLFFQQLNAIQQLNIAALNINIKTLPTQLSLATLKIGDVYVDTTANNVLKVKLV